MTAVEQQSESRLSREQLVKAGLALDEQLAERDLLTALNELNISPDIANVYQKLGTALLPQEGEKLSPVKRLGRGLKTELWDSYLGRTITGTILIASVAEIIRQGGPVDASKAFVAFFNRAIGWAGETIDKPEAIPMILAFSTAVLWTLLSPKVYEIISARDSAKTVTALTKDAAAREKRAAEIQLLKDGNADLSGKIGPNIQIDVGNSDPSALLLINLFHQIGLEVVTYWDQRNLYFDQNPYWQKTFNDWTNRETLLKGDVLESLCSIILVSNGDDVFLSSRKQDPKRQTQDMTDNEAISSINARNAVRKKHGLNPIPHILVTNPHRTIDIGVAKSSTETFKPKTVQQVIKEEYPHAHIIDPDQLILKELAQIAEKDNLPFELITNSIRRNEYKVNLSKAIKIYNRNNKNDELRKKIRLASKKDGLKTLSIVYGSTDEDTIAQIESYAKDFSKEGDLVAIINDPEKITRLPEGTKYVCVGTVVAKGIFSKFTELLNQGAIDLTQQNSLSSEL